MSGWWRLAALIATATLGLGGAYLILSAPEAPRWTIAASGLLAAAGCAAALVIAGVFVSVVIDDVRPAFRFRKPVNPMFIARRNASMVGRQNYSLHPIRFWGGLFLNNRFALVAMVFDEPEHIDFKDEAAHPAQTGAEDEGKR